jgi:hypothetical protein
VRPLKEAIEHSELRQNFHGGRVNGVAAEIAKEVGVLLEDLDVAPGSREQQSSHHARRASADDDQVEI